MRSIRPATRSEATRSTIRGSPTSPPTSSTTRSATTRPRCAAAATRSRTSPTPTAPAARAPRCRQALLDCGYVSARKFGDLYSVGLHRLELPLSERVPPTNAYGIRTPEFYAGEYTLADLQGFVTQAEDSGGGWVPIVFHDICNQCAGSSVSASTISAFLDWLAPRSSNGTLVKTVREVLNGPTPGFPRAEGRDAAAGAARDRVREVPDAGQDPRRAARVPVVHAGAELGAAHGRARPTPTARTRTRSASCASTRSPATPTRRPTKPTSRSGPRSPTCARSAARPPTTPGSWRATGA